jgi:hypothetical protein
MEQEPLDGSEVKSLSTHRTQGVRTMMKILATVAVLSLSMTGVSLAQNTTGGGGSTDSSSGNSSGAGVESQSGTSADTNDTGTASGPGAGASSGGEAACPAGQKPADNYTTADPKCVAE